MAISGLVSARAVRRSMAASRVLAAAAGAASDGAVAAGRAGRGAAGPTGRERGRDAGRGLRGPTSQSWAAADTGTKARSEAMIQAGRRALTVAVYAGCGW